jgi:hypothetical protein
MRLVIKANGKGFCGQNNCEIGKLINYLFLPLCELLNFQQMIIIMYSDIIGTFTRETRANETCVCVVR